MILGVGAEMADHELVAVGRCLGDAIGAAHGARGDDVLDDHLLTQKLANARRKDAPEDIEWSRRPRTE